MGNAYEISPGIVLSNKPPASRIRRVLRKNPLQFLLQRRDIYLDNRPDLISIDRKIVMDKNVSESDDLPPRDLRIFLLRLLGYPTGRFSENLEMVNHSYLDKLVMLKGWFSCCCVLLNFL
jgi:hypothetical protein